MANTFKLKVVTPDGVLYQKDVYLLKINTPKGYTEILPRHMSYITPVTEGVMEIVDDEKLKTRVTYKVGNGLLYVEKENTTLLLEGEAIKVEGK
jgi:F-type H+-transporting ATPase subunit epsilon